MKIKHIDPMGAGRVAALGMQLVERDEVVDVPDDVAPLLLIQTLNWQPADTPAEDLAATVIPEHLAELAAASEASAEVPSPDLPLPEVAAEPESGGEPPAETPTDPETPGEGEPA